MTAHFNRALMPPDGIVIAGGGLAAQRCTETLRRAGYDGPLRLVCGETCLPYDRPPLSKAVLVGDRAAEELSFRSAAWYAEHGVDLLLGVRATGLDGERRRLRLSDGASLPYGRLLIATGASPRTLPALAGYDNVSVLRTAEDARAVRVALERNGPIVLIGGGFIGLEIAASARSLGVPVTLVEAAPSPLAQVLGPELGGWFARLHAEEGVDVHTGVGVQRVEGTGDVRALILADGTRVEAAHVVVGVGVDAAVAWAREAGVAGSLGVPVDPDGRSARPDVYAAGDAACTFNSSLGRHVPGSHWELAARQGAAAARLMLGLAPGRAAPTSFWSDQYGLRIQFVGERRPDDTLSFDGDPLGRSFVATFSRAGRCVAALLVDQPHRLPAIRSAIEKGHPHHELHA